MPTRILKVYTKTITVFIHIYSSRWSQQQVACQDQAFETAANVGVVGKTYIPKIGEERSASGCPYPVVGSTVVNFSP